MYDCIVCTQENKNEKFNLVHLAELCEHSISKEHIFFHRAPVYTLFDEYDDSFVILCVA